MIARRSLLTALVGMPVAGKAAIGHAISGHSKPTLGGLAAGGLDQTCDVNTPDPIFRARGYLERVQNRLERQRWASESASKGELPAHIQSMKSWSPAFKADVAFHDREATNFNPWDFDDAALFKVAKTLGWNE